MQIVRTAAAAVALGLTALAFAPDQALAQQYPWCAVLTDRDGSARNCGFVSLRQCETYISGIGGYCEPNPWYGRERSERRVPQPYR